MNKLLLLVCLLAGTLLTSCTGKPAGVTAVSGFELNRYLGTWYEIARLDHSFERGLTQVSATYSVRDDGGVTVVNRGFDAAHQQWKEARGKAYFVGAADQGHLKVSFFGPFYGSYVIIELDQAQYQYSLVCGPDKDYLWILARTPTLPDAVKQQLLAKAASLGFATDKLIFAEPAR